MGSPEGGECKQSGRVKGGIVDGGPPQTVCVCMCVCISQSVSIF